MKTLNGKLAFGMNIVSSAKRGATSEPELIVNGTTGSFRMTSSLTRALGLANGDYVMFINNVDSIDAAIAQKDESLIAWCEEQGVAMDTTEGAIAIHEAFDVWGIAKGIKEFDAKGNVVKTRVRLTLEDKKQFVEANFDAVYEAAMGSGEEELISALTVEGITKEEQIELLANTIKGDEVDKYRGSKCSNSSNFTGIGNTLTFSNSNDWAALKQGCENPKEINRIYSVDITDVQSVVLSNGFEDVEVKYFILGDYRDEVSGRTKKD